MDKFKINLLPSKLGNTTKYLLAPCPNSGASFFSSEPKKPQRFFEV
jgi:hypothetical protein